MFGGSGMFQQQQQPQFQQQPFQQQQMQMPMQQQGGFQQQQQQQQQQRPQIQLTDEEKKGEEWKCKQCGNLNYAGRTYCNMKTCGAPGPWTCYSCGNKNYSSRMVCNKHGCGRSRPPPKGGQPTPAMQQMGLQVGQPNNVGIQGGLVGMQGGINPQGLQAIAGLLGVNQQALQQLIQQQGGNMNNMNNLGGNVPGSGAFPGSFNVAERATNHPEGSWKCSDCNNVNFPNRMSCNKKSCGRPRHEVDGGAPLAMGQRANPEGSWVCPHCQNVNFPNRTECNRRSCGQPREDEPTTEM